MNDSRFLPELPEFQDLANGRNKQSEIEDFIARQLGSSELQRLILNFMVLFARVEYAMKESDYFEGRIYHSGQKYPVAIASWKKLETAIATNDKWKVFLKSEEGKSTIEYLSLRPPKTQIVEAGKVKWPANVEQTGDVTKLLISAVKTIRNNLFHGGKCTRISTAMAESMRDKQLLAHGITILWAIKDHSDEFRNCLLA